MKNLLISAEQASRVQKQEFLRKNIKFKERTPSLKTGYFVNMALEKSAGAIIFRKENGKIKYLLIQYGWGHWEFPRGMIEKGETLEETVRREIREEVGIEDIKLIFGFKEWFKFFFKLKGKNIMKIATFLLAETETEEIRLSYEHKDFKWLSYEEALKQLTFKNAREVLKKADDFISGKSI